MGQGWGAATTWALVNDSFTSAAKLRGGPTRGGDGGSPPPPVCVPPPSPPAPGPTSPSSCRRWGRWGGGRPAGRGGWPAPRPAAPSCAGGGDTPPLRPLSPAPPGTPLHFPHPQKHTPPPTAAPTAPPWAQGKLRHGRSQPGWPRAASPPAIRGTRFGIAATFPAASHPRTGGRGWGGHRGVSGPRSPLAGPQFNPLSRVYSQLRFPDPAASCSTPPGSGLTGIAASLGGGVGEAPPPAPRGFTGTPRITPRHPWRKQRFPGRHSWIHGRFRTPPPGHGTPRSV